MKKCDILYICGGLDYGDSVSGNYILYYLLSKLEKQYNIKYIGLWDYQQKQKYDPQNFTHFESSLVNKTNEELDSIIPDHKILFLAGDDLTNKQLEYLHEKFNNRTIICMMTNWAYGCGKNNCPSWQAPHPEIEGDLLGSVPESRLETYNKINCGFVNVSSYSLKVQQKSLFSKLDSFLIPLPFQQIYIANKEKHENKHEKIILWGSAHPTTRRKGLPEFQEALRILNDKHPTLKNIEIHTAGPNPHLNCPYRVIDKGPLNAHQMSLAYQQADVFALTTLADAGPMMATEAVKNNTPLVAFNTNVAMDITSNGINGYTVNNTEEFADKLYAILFEADFEINHDFVKKFNSEESVLSKYKDLFNLILK
tara:strand:- start:2931 stop:4031 length:1101 start_codon:yes stop_codon:yes gene_type:complete